MIYKKVIGVLAYHGDVREHIQATQESVKNLRRNIKVIPVRSREDVHTIDALIIPGGESTTLEKLCEREGIFEDIKGLKFIFGTCAGAIMLAKTIYHQEKDQKTLELMDIQIDRNAYGRQAESFEIPIKTTLGSINAVFIRAPKINKIGKGVKLLAKMNKEIIACEQKTESSYYLATCFHPELTSTIFHEYFLKQIYRV